jgi:ferredoxin
MAKIIHEREKCIGCGACASICPKFWSLSEDGKATLKDSVSDQEGNYEIELENLECNQDAADTCPVQCIMVVLK